MALCALNSEVEHIRIESQMTKRAYKQLTESQRHAIALGLQQSLSIRAIARALGRSPSTICREIQRNSGGAGYSSGFAEQRCQRRRQHSRAAPKLHPHSRLFAQVFAMLR